jgi:predicted HicB family RNase H-like nuclease
MKELNLRIPDDLHAALKERAETQQRSMNGHVLWLIARDVQPAPTVKEATR